MSKQKLGRDSWAQHLEHSQPPPVVEADPVPLQNEEAPKMVVELRSFKFMNKENGFMIAQGKAHSPPVNLPVQWKGRFNPNAMTVKGSSLSLADINAVGTVVECEGDWVLDPKYGLQFQFSSAREAMPSTIEALRKYFSAGRIKGIGPATGNLIVDKWGMDTLKMLDENPDALKEIPGLTETKVEAIKKEWATKRALYHLTSFFGLYGIGEVWIPKIVEALGEKGLEARVRDNPYLLTTVEGIGFATADKMGLSLGIEANSPKRTNAMLRHVLDEYTNKQGHTACPVDEWLRQAGEQLRQSPQELQAVAQNLINEGLVVLRTLPVNTAILRSPNDAQYSGNAPEPIACVSLKAAFMNERAIATDLRRIKDSLQPLTDMEVMEMNKHLAGLSGKLDPSQLEGVIGVLKNGVSVLTGGPGTGKTTTLKSVIDIAENMGWKVVLAAPTGRAAKRMAEAIGRPSGTLHRTLQFNPKEGFKFNRQNPLVGQLFVVDESSMLDNALAASWLRALPKNARVIFVGDIDQLPSVGPGAYLKDMMDSGVADVFRLTRVHRQAEGSLIAEAAQKVLAGKMPPLDGDPMVDDFSWVAPPSNLSSAEINEFSLTAIETLVTNFLKKGYKKDDIQILSPQRDGLVGVQGLNYALRWTLNHHGVPTTAQEEDEPFALGDRVLVTKNNYDKDIFNGDMGVIQKLEDDGSLEMLMEDGKVVQLEGVERKSLTLGYAITVHKSQGGERPVIIMTCSPSHTFSMNKNLIYTGITRGRNKVVIVGSPKTLNIALRKQEKMYRITGLKEEIRKALHGPIPSTPKIKG